MSDQGNALEREASVGSENERPRDRLIAGSNRRETGPVQFGSDWPGIFIRGDEALGHAIAIECLVADIRRGDPPSVLDVASVAGLGRTLASCDTRAAADEEGDQT